MTQEEKQLLLKDLCARFPYGVKVHITYDWFYDEIELYDRRLDCDVIRHLRANEYTVKPYLRPMSSMTEEEENKWRGFNIDPLLEAVGKPHTRIEDLMLITKSQYEPLDWLNEHHFDYRGLIPMGLAIETTEGMYND